MRADLMNPLILAYLGDGVFETMVREYLVVELEICKPNDLQKKAITFVSAAAQRKFIETALENEWLSEKEIDIYKRGRNTKTGKNETVDHSYSTGFEAIIGQLHLEDNKARIDEIFALYKTVVEQNTKI
ncbi:MAG: Mini-ribonuclease 3 [Coprobacillaceae bacterium]